MRLLIIVPFLAIACGGRVLDDAGNNGSGVGGTEKTELADGGSSDASPPPPSATATAAPDAALPPPPTDAGGSPGKLVSCTDGPATGSPMGCGPDTVCREGDDVTDAWARDLLSCYVDRCSTATTGKPWCGTISLKFGGNGCTMDYVEDGPGTGGCVKYQGYYRAWPCLAGKSVTVTRPCP